MMCFVNKEWFDLLRQIKWRYAIGLLLLHIGAAQGAYILVKEAKWATIIFVYLLVYLAGIGTLVGAHRLFTHQSFKANRKLTFILGALQTLSGQRSVIEWALDHHTHHKYEGTNADIVSLNRGFFYAHIGWEILERHPECEEKRNKLDVNYLWSDPIVNFQHQYYWYLFLVINCLLPTIIPYLLFNESLSTSFYTCFLFRYIYSLQLALSGNSIAHVYGYKEYDTSSTGTHSKALNYLTFGGVYHNFHHAFPQDYSESEFGIKTFNCHTAFIDFFAWMGWAYDLKKVPQKYVDLRKQRTGGTTDDNAFYKRHSIGDWILGWFISAIIIWTVIIFRLF